VQATTGVNVNLAPYWVDSVPSTITVYEGDAFKYTLPSLIDVEGDDFVISVDVGSAIIFLTYDNGVFNIPKGKTDETMVNIYEIKILVTDSAGSTLKTEIKLIIKSKVVSAVVSSKT